ncbi:organic cation transporter protein-like [Bicyclus anynana]|uniref:Organic cation transporter protein-like n=1 Tax=Bicyclus anynana TaxID=110368 RepID=A0A6J1MS30_BICAN|nr:organic cation transporter protein-like [Bicyclus anynana]
MNIKISKILCGDKNNCDGDSTISDGKNEPEGKSSEGQESVVEVSEKPLSLDDVLTNELGQFGWFQIRNILLAAVLIILCGFGHEYIFSAGAIPHRCRIPECGENEKLHKYDPNWILNAIPGKDTGLTSCERYAPMNVGVSGSLESCPATLFNKSEIVPCVDYVYATDNTVVFEFDLGCNEWLRALAGTVHSVGSLLVLPIVGYISDRFGRRTALILSVFNFGLFSFIRAFSVNYTMYLVFHLLQSTLGCGVYSSAYIFATELVGPNYRVFTNAIAISMFAIGEVILGLVAWLIPSWRYMIIAVSLPCFIVISYRWMLTESVRWLLSKKKFSEAEEILKTAARVNKTHISDKSLKALTNSLQTSANPSTVVASSLIRRVITSPILLRRVCTISVWWLSTALIFYGLSINSTGISDTMHLNYILTSAIEIPGYVTAALTLDRFGRKITMSSGFFFSAVCNIAFVFVPRDFTVPRLIMYLLGKYGIAIVATSVYLFTSELYPTEFRHSLLAFCSMIGRIGSIAAPLTPVLVEYWHGIPSLLFGGFSILAGLLVLTQPETLGTKMPDTLAEAEAIGKIESKVASSC